MSLFRDFHIGLGEERYFEFRAESFNLFNNVVWGTPDNTNTDRELWPNHGPTKCPKWHAKVADESEVLLLVLRPLMWLQWHRCRA